MKDFIVKLRKSMGLSQEELSRELGISRPTFVSIEKGERDITFAELKKIAEIFDIMDDSESVHVETHGKANMVSLVEQPDGTVFTKQEQNLIKAVCHKWKKAKTDELVLFTHNQMPWKVCKPREIIPYTLINNEEPENVY